MEIPQRTSKPRDRIMIATRLDPQFVSEVQEIADREYEGKLAMTLRAALRRFVDEKRAEHTESREQVAA